MLSGNVKGEPKIVWIKFDIAVAKIDIHIFIQLWIQLNNN